MCVWGDDAAPSNTNRQTDRQTERCTSIQTHKHTPHEHTHRAATDLVVADDSDELMSDSVDGEVLALLLDGL